MKRNIYEEAIRTLEMETEAVARLKDHIDEAFGDAVQCVLECTGRVIVTGMGKSGHVGRKIAATFASTGTPAFFLHPAEAYHGDLGMVTEQDVVLAISNSGEANEIIAILPIIRRIGAKIIAMSGRKESTLVENSDFFLNIAVEREACPLGLAPTCSTTATLAMGDAVAVALMSERKFTQQNFALFHPGGALGRKLLLTVKDLMHTGEECPVVEAGKSVKDALFIMTEKGLGAALVVETDGKLIGLLTDGMIRRGLAENYQLLDAKVETIMFKTPLTITTNKMAAAALSVMEKHQPRPVTVLPVLELDGRVAGIIHLTDLLRQGVV